MSWIFWQGNRVFAFGEDTLALRLSSELADLRSGYANPPPAATGFKLIGSLTKQKGHPLDVLWN